MAAKPKPPPPRDHQRHLRLDATFRILVDGTATASVRLPNDFNAGVVVTFRSAESQMGVLDALPAA
jgi:hypothetical protein